VNSIFPSLDSIIYMSERFYGVLSSCNHGYHPLISKQNSDHSGFSQILIAKLKEMRRKQWHAPASHGNAAASPIPEGAVRLEVTLSQSDDQLRAQVRTDEAPRHTRELCVLVPRPPSGCNGRGSRGLQRLSQATWRRP
jgi:hypothetical protein